MTRTIQVQSKPAHPEYFRPFVRTTLGGALRSLSFASRGRYIILDGFQL